MLEDVPYIRLPIEKLRANTLVNVCMTGMWHKFCKMDLVDKGLLLLRPNTPEGSQRQEATFNTCWPSSVNMKRHDSQDVANIKLLNENVFEISISIVYFFCFKSERMQLLLDDLLRRICTCTAVMKVSWNWQILIILSWWFKNENFIFKDS